jgi:ribonuclease HI
LTPVRRLVLHIDGGAAPSNPGPAAIGVVIHDADGNLVEELAERIGWASNNAAEYRALLRGLERARELGASELEVINDSELVARQINGVYKVKDAGLKTLYDQARAAIAGFASFSIRNVPRAENARADRLVNEAREYEN